MSRRQSSKIELPSDVPTNAAYGNRSPLSPHSTLNVPLMMRERNVEAALMKPPTNGLYSSAAASTVGFLSFCMASAVLILLAVEQSFSCFAG
jgi:hypothetical protein